MNGPKGGVANQGADNTKCDADEEAEPETEAPSSSCKRRMNGGFYFIGSWSHLFEMSNDEVRGVEVSDCA